MMRVFLFASALLLCWPAYGGVRVVVPSHDITRGTTLSDSDLTFATVNGNVMNGTVMNKGDLVGLQARRFLRMGENVRLEDVRHPVLVSKGTTVTMSFEAPGIVLTASVKAMSEGGMGDTVTVQNPASYRQISAVVIGPGQVRAQMGGARLASLQP
jgi:flagellar basal body P-ring formation protein FlgA